MAINPAYWTAPSANEDWINVPPALNELKAWALARRFELQNLNRPVGPLKNADITRLRQKLLDMEKDAPTSESRESFIEWITYSDYELWDQYINEQKKINKQKAVEEHNAALNAAKQRASGAAVRIRNDPNRDLSGTTVIAGVTDISAQKAWVGYSGVGNHAVRNVAKDSTNPNQAQAQRVVDLMNTLLQGVKKVEEWPVEACGEVDAFMRYFLEKQIFTVEAIPSNYICSHAETWDDKQKKWKSRSACNNCQQWLQRLQIFLS